MFAFFIGCMTFWLAGLCAYDYSDRGYEQLGYLWSGIYLVASSAVAALHSYSFTILIFKYRRHLRRSGKALEDMV